MARTKKPIENKDTLNIVETTYRDPESGKDKFIGGMITSSALKKTGYETRASLASASRLYPEGNGGTRAGGRTSESSDYYHIENSASPFHNDHCGVGSHLSIELCQKAFYSFPAFRNPIVMQSYLANSPLHFVGENDKINNFYREWAEKVGLWDVANKFFLEWWRSGNVFFYRFDGELKLNEIKKIAANKQSVARNRKIPLKYILLNPADIRGLGSSAFTDQMFAKVLNPYEVEMIKLGKTEEDRAIYDSLDEDAKNAIRMRQSPIVRLDPKRLALAFNAKQDYEPMSVPPYFGVLQSINFKQILRTAEAKVAASADFCILLLTAGEKEGGENNAVVIQGLLEMFAMQDVGRVIVSDYTTKGEFLIPDFNKIFGKEKFENVDQDIINGMNDIMAKDENFATGQTKTKIYLQLLSQARESFLKYFLIPEMQRIAEEMGFKEIPAVSFEEITLDSLMEGRKLYNRLYELGALAPKDLLHAYETDQLPTYENSLENQREFKALKKSELYEPLIGNKPEPAAGRPTGTGTPKTKKTVAPKGGKASLAKIKDNMPRMTEVFDRVNAAYKEKNGISRLSKKHKELVNALAERIIISQPIENWNSSVAEFIENPMKFEMGEQYDEILELSEEHSISSFSAAMIFHAKEE